LLEAFRKIGAGLLGLLSPPGRAASLAPKSAQEAGERIVLEKIAKHWNQQHRFDRPDGRVIVTNRRFLFRAGFSRRIAEAGSLSFPIERIEKLAVTRVLWVSPAVRFEVDGRAYVFTFFTGAAKVAAAIERERQSRR
jgi:hypothetical protein